MDYIVGFLFGYLLKEVVSMLNKLSQWDWENRTEYEYDLIPLPEDDLP